MTFRWEGHNVHLVPLGKTKHFDNCIRWPNDPENTQWTLIGDLPPTRVAEAEYFGIPRCHGGQRSERRRLDRRPLGRRSRLRADGNLDVA